MRRVQNIDEVLLRLPYAPHEGRRDRVEAGAQDQLGTERLDACADARKFLEQLASGAQAILVPSRY
jgi:hypothetical protein